jgi:hypothetical protein
MAVGNNDSSQGKQPDAEGFINLKIKSKDGQSHAIRGGAPLRSKFAADNALLTWAKANAIDGVVVLDPSSIEVEVRLVVDVANSTIEFVGI